MNQFTGSRAIRSMVVAFTAAVLAGCGGPPQQSAPRAADTRRSPLRGRRELAPCLGPCPASA